MIKKKYFNSIKKKVIFLDLVIVFPLLIIFCSLMLFVFGKSNYELNHSKLNVLEEKSSSIADRNAEIIKITNMFYLNSDINRLLSKKQQLTGYDYIAAKDEIQSKMLEMTELFPERQYQLMFLCNNGTSYFQASLQLAGANLTYDDISKENWYEEVESDTVYFLPKYRSQALQELFKEDTLFAVRNIRNLNSGRYIGVLIVAVSRDIWGKNSIQEGNSSENTIVIDQYRKIIFSSDAELYGTDVSDNSYYEQISEHSKGFFLGNVNQKYCYIRFADIEGTGWKIITYEPYKRNWSLYVVLIFVMGLATLLGFLAIVFYNCSFISRRMNRMNKNILEVSGGNLKARICDDYETEFQEVCFNFNRMLDKIEELMRQLELEEKEKHALEIQTLQAQINPHFFYNTLVTIRFMIQMEQYQDADRAMLAFSKLLRKSFANSQKIISVREELSMTEEYLELMTLRYKNQFQWNITIDANVAERGILKNVVQPLVENSISHGFNMKEGMGHILIRAYGESGAVVIEVEDDGVGVELEKIKRSIESRKVPKVKEQFSGIGLSNIQMRIVRNFGEMYGLTVTVNASGGVTFKMKIPAIDLKGEGN